jgi:hypothetical protein
MNILTSIGIAHPEYILLSEEWEKYRYIMEGGDDFIEQYLQQFSARETDTDFANRKTVTTTAAFARGAIIDIKNSIFQRMSDISRKGGSKEYQEVIKGLNGGVDKRGSSMNHFIGRKVLQELLFLGKVGVFVDMPRIKDNPTLNDVRGKVPYFYSYAAEDILNWDLAYTDNTMEFTKLFLRDNYYKSNILGLPTEPAYRYRLLEKTPDGIIVSFYEANTFPSNLKDIKSVLPEPTDVFILEIPKIPFVLFELEQPLIRDIANHQILLMNLESSDASYILKANIPLYTEQRSQINSDYLKSEENSKNGTEIEAGGNIGRAYSPGMDRPGFIHPSSEPLQASMEKQKNLKDDIRTLINLSLSNIKSKYASAESKELDDRGLESGLSALGLLLEQGERELATIFASYSKQNEIATIAYPQKYSLKTDLQKLGEVEKLSEQRDKIPSVKCRKIISKKMAEILIGTEVSAEDLQEILEEIDAANYTTGSSEEISSDIEHGLVSLETASAARGYDKNEIEQAKEDHAERLARIQTSQSKNESRGNNDLSSESGSAKLEKEQSQNPDITDTGKKSVKE